MARALKEGESRNIYYFLICPKNKFTIEIFPIESTDGTTTGTGLVDASGNSIHPDILYFACSAGTTQEPPVGDVPFSYLYNFSSFNGVTVSSVNFDPSLHDLTFIPEITRSYYDTIKTDTYFIFNPANQNTIIIRDNPVMNLTYNNNLNVIKDVPVVVDNPLNCFILIERCEITSNVTAYAIKEDVSEKLNNPTEVKCFPFVKIKFTKKRTRTCKPYDGNEIRNSGLKESNNCDQLKIGNAYWEKTTVIYESPSKSPCEGKNGFSITEELEVSTDLHERTRIPRVNIKGSVKIPPNQEKYVNPLPIGVMLLEGALSYAAETVINPVGSTLGTAGDIVKGGAAAAGATSVVTNNETVQNLADYAAALSKPISKGISVLFDFTNKGLADTFGDKKDRFLKKLRECVAGDDCEKGTENLNKALKDKDSDVSKALNDFISKLKFKLCPCGKQNPDW